MIEKQSSGDDIRIAAVVATHNRPFYLANRSLKSIEMQTRQPDYLVVVDDSDPKYRRLNQNIKTDFASRWTTTVYLENYRTPGASGAWNTALAWLLRYANDVFVAILDDDDSWDREYLEECSKSAISKDLDMVVGGLVRHDGSNPKGQPQSIPQDLDAQDFLTGNPHIQGSNLFIRLKTLLHAGGFDESFQSTTDRDLCIRLADLGTVRFGSLQKHFVHHYAESSENRLSTYGSERKRSGLNQFYKKYECRMSESQREKFLRRSEGYFGINPEGLLSASGMVEAQHPIEEDGTLHLVVGVISSHHIVAIENLLRDLKKLQMDHEDVEMEIVVLENSGGEEDTRLKLRDTIHRLATGKFRVDFIDYEHQRTDADAGTFGSVEIDNIERKSIATSRTMVQHYVYVKCQLLPGSVAWILDDDSRLDNLLCHDGLTLKQQSRIIVDNIKRMKKEGVAVCLGTITGDPPLPFTSCVRTQLVDLYHNLERIAVMDSSEEFPSPSSENMALREQFRDYYYDLSRDETDHLEFPFWFTPNRNGMTVMEALSELVGRLPEIKDGKQVFRPLVGDLRADPLSKLLPSIHRGGNTFIYHISSLRDFPNTVPNIHGKDTRRSDMVWCLLNRFVTGRKILEAIIPVRQDRSHITNGVLDFDKLVEDIQGYAVYSALQDVFQAKAKELQLVRKKTYGLDLVEFSPDDLNFALERFRKYLNERTLAFEMSYLRIIGLLDGFERYVDPENAPKYWWLNRSDCDDVVQSLSDFIMNMKEDYLEDSLPSFRSKVEDVKDDVIESYFTHLGCSVDEFKASQPLVTNEFKSFAESLLRTQFQAGELKYLGHGEEGIVFTDDNFVYKYIYHWKKHLTEDHLDFISSFGRRRDLPSSVYPVAVKASGENICITYPYEPGVQYQGGHLDDILVFLREWRHSGIVYRNVHPSNFIVTKEGLRLIDYGLDIAPFGEKDYLQMCRRAFLMYRYHYRSDLKDIMRKALTRFDFPESYGFEHFVRAVHPREIHEMLHPTVLKEILACNPTAVLDYGCGKGKICEELNRQGVAAHGFDVDEGVIQRCHDYGSKVNYLPSSDMRELIESGTKFDAVVCSIVLCMIDQDEELREVLYNIRQIVRSDGRIIVTICNPYYTSTERTEIQERILPPGSSYGGIFEYEKTIATNQNVRTDTHRPYSWYEREFRRAGFEVESVSESEGTDTQNLCYASDFLIIRLKRRDLPQKGRVSLLIKTCAMEWKSIEHQIRHLVRQLEFPRIFHEKVIVTDTYAKDFLRQYEDPHFDRHNEALNRLLDEGIIDRVVTAPYDEKIIRDTNKRWFGMEEPVTHASNGQNVFPTLHGIESCEGDYVLQVDSDLLIGRLDKDHDYLDDMISVFESDPKALTVSFNIFQSKSKPYTSEGPSGEWRVEVRNCLLHKSRLLSVLPIENEIKENKLELPWHRALDRLISTSNYSSYRGGDNRSFFIHVPNKRKGNLDDIYAIMDRVEDSAINPEQDRYVDLVGDWTDWAGPKRKEPYIFIICSRNVHPGKFKECWDSVAHQDFDDWGAVIVDGASENGLGDYIERVVEPYRDRVTLVRDKESRGLLFNTWSAITHFCSNENSVIITLDADDALLGPHVIERVMKEYNDGADITVGSMLRTDKEAEYIPDFDRPRRKRGGNVWQHLRTFRKYLFDQIDVEDLKIDDQWIDVATDWQFMIPIVEMAESPRYIEDKLYYYEPSAEKAERRKIRENIIAKIVAKPEYPKDGD